MNFTEWWQAYPRKCGKLDAEKAYKAAIKKGATHGELVEAVKRWKFPSEGSFVPYPASWLRAGHWLDELQIGRTTALFVLGATPISWNGTAQKLIAEIGEAKWQTWFADTELQLGDPATIWARKPSQVVWIRNKYRPQLERILGVNEVRVEIRHG